MRVRRALLAVVVLASCASSPPPKPGAQEIAVASAAPPPSAAPPATTSTKPSDPVLEAVGNVALTPREREEWGTAITEQIAPCPKSAATVAECLVGDRGCALCVPAAKALLAMVKRGVARDRMAAAYAARFDPRAARDIPIDGSPILGPEGAPVTVVAFVDFECPACAATEPALAKAVADHSPHVRLVHKSVALPQHPHAELAARAAVAAGLQRKFWAMHDALFAHQRALEQRDIEAYAKSLGLDVRRFTRDLRAPQVLARVDADKKLWQDLDASATPAIYVNGRRFDSDAGSLDEWIDDALSAATPSR